MREPNYLTMKHFPLYVGNFDGSALEHMFSFKFHTIYVVPGYYPKDKWQLWVRDNYYKETPEIVKERKTVLEYLEKKARELHFEIE
jgi:thioredoxin-related protein